MSVASAREILPSAPRQAIKMARYCSMMIAVVVMRRASYRPVRVSRCASLNDLRLSRCRSLAYHASQPRAQLSLSTLAAFAVAVLRISDPPPSQLVVLSGSSMHRQRPRGNPTVSCARRRRVPCMLSAATAGSVWQMYSAGGAAAAMYRQVGKSSLSASLAMLRY